MQERIESLSQPGAKKTEKAHAGLGGRWTARSPTDLALNDQQAPPALRDTVVNWHARTATKTNNSGKKRSTRLQLDVRL